MFVIKDGVITDLETGSRILSVEDGGKSKIVFEGKANQRIGVGKQNKNEVEFKDAESRDSIFKKLSKGAVCLDIEQEEK